MRRKNSRLAIEAKYRSVNVRFLCESADVVRQITRRKIVRTIDHNVVTGDDFECVLAREPALVGFDLDRRIHVPQTITRRIQFLPADVFGAVQNLPLQIAKIDIVEIDQTQFANAGGGQIKRGRRTKSARANPPNTSLIETAWPVRTDLPHASM